MELNPTQKWLAYFETDSTDKIGQTPKFQEILKANKDDYDAPSAYFLSSTKLHILDKHGVYGFLLQDNQPTCISSTMLHPID
jgi:hypothetical protein